MILLENYRGVLYKQKEFNHKKFLKVQDFYDLGFCKGKGWKCKTRRCYFTPEIWAINHSRSGGVKSKNYRLTRRVF